MNNNKAYAWLGSEASIWAHRGYEVRGEKVICEDLDDARRVVAVSLGVDLVCIDVGDGAFYYRTQEDADRDSDGSSADAVVAEYEEETCN